MKIYPEICMCGKIMLKTEEEAQKVVRQVPNQKAYYFCKISETYHTSSKKFSKKAAGSVHGTRHFKFRPRRLLKELKSDMASSSTLRKLILDFMEERYKSVGTIKFSSGMVHTYLKKARPQASKNYINSEISYMKKDGLIVSLNEKVPNQKGAVYFALNRDEILDKLTEPETKVKTKVKEEDTSDGNITVTETKPKIPEQPQPLVMSSVVTTSPKPSNPLDKISSQLGELLTKINGLTQGYSEVAANVRSQNGLLTDHMNDLDKFENLIKGIPRGTVVEAPDFEPIQKRFDQIESLWSNQSDEYKRGIRDGIRIAIEMGLQSVYGGND